MKCLPGIMYPAKFKYNIIQFCNKYTDWNKVRLELEISSAEI